MRCFSSLDRQYVVLRSRRSRMWLVPDSLLTIETRKWIVCKMTFDAEDNKTSDEPFNKKFVEILPGATHYRCDATVLNASLAFSHRQGMAVVHERDARSACGPSSFTEAFLVCRVVGDAPRQF